MIIHGRQIDSSASANVPHLGRLKARLGEDMARGFQYPDLRGVARRAILPPVLIGHLPNRILKHVFE
jgi:hypothetical protein